MMIFNIYLCFSEPKTLTMENDLKIGAVFSLAPGDKSPPPPDDATNYSAYPSGVADETQSGVQGNDTENIPSPACNNRIVDNEELTLGSADDLPPVLSSNSTNEPDYTEMTADDCAVSGNIENEADDVITGADPEMNISTEVNDLDIDIENGGLNKENTLAHVISTENPPILPMEGKEGVLSSVFPEEMEEALPPPILSPVISDTVKVKEEPIEYDG